MLRRLKSSVIKTKNAQNRHSTVVLCIIAKKFCNTNVKMGRLIT